MDIQYAILGLLSWQTFSGYDIKRIIAESDVFYWSGNNNQIYNSLIALHKDGLVTQEVRYQESLPAKKLYSITPAGRQMLQRWLLSNPELPEVHNPFLIQLGWADILPGEELDHLLARYEEEIQVQLSMRLAAGNQTGQLPGRTARERFLWQKINQHVVDGYRHELDWVRQVREGLRAVKFAEGEVEDN